jgi:hypothetical protein
MRADQKTMFVRWDNQTNQWTMGEKEPLKGPPYPKFVLGEDHVGVYKFQIVGSGNVNFHPTEPFVAKGANPPDFANQFLVVDGAGTNKLIVLDVNSGAPGVEYAGGDYVYQLQFDTKKPLDPIITNGGCCKPTIYSHPAFLAVGSIALLALAYLVLWPILKRWRAGGS